MLKVAVFSISLLLAACNTRLLVPTDAASSGDGETPSLSALSDGSYTLRIDRAWDGMSGNIHFPSDQFDESDYQPVQNGPRYAVVLSNQRANVSIGDPANPMKGSAGMASSSTIAFDLADGTFAGGRFVVWAVQGSMQAELTIYGSARPIVKSERGALTRP